MSSSKLVVLNENEVRELLDWSKVFNAVEASICAVSKKHVFQNARSFTDVLNTDNVLLTMPGFLEDKKYGALACKLVTMFPGNNNRKPPLQSILANIALFNEATGELKAIIAGTEITTWRTATASAVATKHILDIKEKKREVLAVMGAGAQGRIHAIAFQHFFNFKQVRIWNHRSAKAQALVDELNEKSSLKEFVACGSVEECVKNADVIVTATSASVPFLKLHTIKHNVHINAVGAGANQHHSELEEAIYKVADIFVDYYEGAKTELAGLEKLGIKFRGEIGELINQTSPRLNPNKITVFQSLGMAVEDCAMARMIYDLHMEKVGTPID